MNAPAPSAAPASDLRFFPRREDYVPTVRIFCPCAEGEELSLRCSLLLLRDHSTATKLHCSDEAYDVLDTVERLAARYCYASMPAAALEMLRYQLVRLVACASGLQAFSTALAGPPREGKDGRG